MIGAFVILHGEVYFLMLHCILEFLSFKPFAIAFEVERGWSVVGGIVGRVVHFEHM